MAIKPANTHLSKTLIDSTLWAIERSMLKTGRTLDDTDRLMYPLNWYIATGRAPTRWILCLCNCKPHIIGNMLAKGGSDDEVIGRLKAYIMKKFPEEGFKEVTL